MFDGFDHDELLAYVEDSLDPARAAALRRRLAAQPQAAVLIERLRADRDALRALEEPAAPDDLMAELEPMLARPMLMPRQPDWRRRYRRRRRWPLVAAAGLGMLLIPGVLWAVASGWLARTAGVELAGSAPVTAERRPAPGPAREVPAVAARGAEDAIEASGPGAAPEDVALAPGRTPEAAPRDRRPAGEPPKLVPAEFVLVVRAAEESAVVESLRRSLEGLGVDGALVRNFTIAEAQELAILGARGGPVSDVMSGSARADAGVASGARAPVIPVRPGRSRPPFDEAAPSVEPSAQLWGRREIAPGYDRQLEFSQRGAVFTVSLPAGRLADLLARLELEEGRQAMLRIASPPGEAGAGSDPGAAAQAWLRDYPRVRAALEALRADPEALIHLPVAVEE